MNKTYRISLQSRIQSLLVFLLALIVIVAMFAGPGILRDPIKWFFHTAFLASSWMLIWIALIFLFLSLFLFFVIRSARYFVTVESESLTLNLPYPQGFQQTRKGHLYNTIRLVDITRAVYTRFPQSVRIYSRTHMTRIIPLESLDNKEELLEALKGQLGEKLVVSKGLIDPLFLSQIASIVMVLVVCATWLIEPFDLSFVWTPVIEKPTLTFIHVKAYSLDEDGQSTWILSRDSFSDTYQVLKITGKNIESWEKLPSDYHDVQISHDSYGNPVVIKEEQTIQWQNGEWETIPFQGEKLRFSWRDRPTVQGSKFWETASFGGNKNHEIVGIDFASGQSERIPLPPGMEGDWLSNIQVNNDGSLTAEMTVNESKWLYIYKDGQWMQPGYPLEKGTWMFDPIDYCVDAEGRPWVLQGFSEGFRVGRYSPESNSWNWISLNPFSNQGEKYSALQVDQRGRLWLQGDIDYDDFVRVYDVLPKGLYELEEYNEYNSKLPHDFMITLGQDGKMWVAGDNLSYIDSNAPNLPQPAPDWLAALGTLTARLVIVFFYLCTAIIMVGTQTIVLRKK